MAAAAITAKATYPAHYTNFACKEQLINQICFAHCPENKNTLPNRKIQFSKVSLAQPIRGLEPLTYALRMRRSTN